MFKNVVLSDGTLNEQEILKSEPIYQGMNGRFVERFYLTPTRSYIFKPLTHFSQSGKEVWIHEHVLPEFPAVYPKIMAHSASDVPERNWIILEDLGSIKHVFEEKLIMGLVKLVSAWHSLSNSKLQNAGFKGPKPYIEEISAYLSCNKKEVMSTDWGLDLPQSLINTVLNQIECYTFHEKKVISHGDLHVGNYGYAGNKIVVLDWEHAHFNSPYWDLYHLLDISHPDFPKNINIELRKLAIECYLEESYSSAESAYRDTFYQGYLLFAAAFSIWMLLLIKEDLKREEARWSHEQLNRQLQETKSSLGQCAEELERINLNNKVVIQ
ncbi:phosphotransferase [Mesobacillus foraminis]|uniref:phosphotransferase n=1 Tax=Mesobacillus foraminis TaxID=279826 RepID=UPI00399FE5D0